MNKSFTYSVLKYRASYFLDERINVGLLFHFIDDGKIVFVYPRALSRLGQLHPKIDLTIIKHYLRGFKSKADELSLEITGVHKNHIKLQQEFLLEDANSFFFTESKNGNYNSIPNLITYYESQYFNSYQVKKTPKKHNEAFLVKRFTEILTKEAGTEKVIDLFKKNVEYGNELGNTVFDFAWQNGTTNLLKSISFDLLDRDYIQSKSFRWYGELSRLREKTLNDQYRFDLLIAPPRRKELFSSYDKALMIFEDIDGPKHIIEERDLKDYIIEAVSSVKPLLANPF